MFQRFMILRKKKKRCHIPCFRHRINVPKNLLQKLHVSDITKKKTYFLNKKKFAHSKFNCIRKECVYVNWRCRNSINSWMCDCSYGMHSGHFVDYISGKHVHNDSQSKRHICLLFRRFKSNNNNNCKHVGCNCLSAINKKFLLG